MRTPPIRSAGAPRWLVTSVLLLWTGLALGCATGGPPGLGDDADGGVDRRVSLVPPPGVDGGPSSDLAGDRPGTGPGDPLPPRRDGGGDDGPGADATPGPDAGGGDVPVAPDLPGPPVDGPGPGLTPTVQALEPADGLASAASLVTLTGSGFEAGARLTVAGVLLPATACDASGAPDRLVCTVPARPEGALRGDVTVTNPGGQSATLAGAWTYTSVSSAVDFCNVQYPRSLTVAGGNPARPRTPVDVYSQLYVAGLTSVNDGPAPGVIGQLGLGPDAASGDDLDPTRSTRWRYVQAQPNPSFNGFGGNNDEYYVLYTPPAAGTYRYVFRYSLDGGLSYSYCDADDGSNTFDASRTAVMEVVEEG